MLLIRSPRTWAWLVVALSTVGCVTIDSGVAEAPTATPFIRPVVTSRPPPPARPATPAPSSVPTPSSAPTQPGPTGRPGASPTPPPTPRGSTSGACGDDAFELSGYKWEGIYRWSFDAESTPRGMDQNAVIEVLEKSASNIETAFNDCGLPDNVDITIHYRGVTKDKPCEGEVYGLNVIGFGDIPDRLGPGTIAYTCPYENTRTHDYVEADIVINRSVEWALSEDECSGFQELLEATITHELGHVFGLDHVNERRHGDLTMSPRSNGACAADEITLGLGDVLGLEELYGTTP